MKAGWFSRWDGSTSADRARRQAQRRDQLLRRSREARRVERRTDGFEASVYARTNLLADLAVVPGVSGRGGTPRRSHAAGKRSRPSSGRYGLQARRMKILVVGSGGREHALVWRLAQAGHAVVAAPGNPGIAELARCVPIGVDEHDAAGRARARRGRSTSSSSAPRRRSSPGSPTSCARAASPTFGPGADGARLEGSKAFSKQFFARHAIPTAPFAVVARRSRGATPRSPRSAARSWSRRTGSRRARASSSRATPREARAAAREMLEARRFGDAGRDRGDRAEDRRPRGRRCSRSPTASTLEVLPAGRGSQDDLRRRPRPEHRRDGHGVARVDERRRCSRASRARSSSRRCAGSRADGIDYRGVLYAGVMVDAAGTPWLLEYNCRFGDPETQPIMARMRGDLGAVLLGAARGAMPHRRARAGTRASRCASWSRRPATRARCGPATRSRGARGAADDVDRVPRRHRAARTASSSRRAAACSA